MPRSTVIAFAIGALALFGAAAAQQKPASPLVEVFKSPTCGCCSQWVEHMRKSGFTVRTTDLNDLTEIKKSRGVPGEVQSCHTAVVNGYVVEGHVPPADVHRLLKEKPAIAGIAVGGMPIGSPGMETPYVKADPFNVMSFTKSGAMSVFAKH
jgi:hypothetical protein